MKTLTREEEYALIERLYARDETAMAFFYKSYKKALYRTIWCIVRHEELAEDILQESMVKFWLTFATYTPSKGRLFTWALNISRNLAIDHLRQQRRTTYRTDSLSSNPMPDLAAPLTFRPEHTGVRDWLNLLAPHDRELLSLLYLQGYTHVETAEQLQLPLGTVKSSVRRSIRTLARLLRASPSPR